MIKVKVIALLLMSAVFSSFQMNAADVEFKGKLTTQAGIGIPNGHDSSNEGDFLLGMLAAEGAVTAYSDNNTFYADASLSYDYIVKEDNLTFRIKEAWYDYNGGWWTVRVGRQLTAWGAADGIQVADVLCPQDQTSLWSSDYSESRLGIDALRLSLSSEVITSDFYWIPLFTPNELPLKEGNPLKKIMIPSDINIGKVTKDNFEEPEIKLSTGEYAARIKAFLPFADISFYGFYGWDDMPVLKYSINRQSIDISGTYERMTMFGMDASIPVGPIMLRLEGAVFPARTMSTSPEAQMTAQIKAMMSGKKDFEYFVRRNEFAGLIGIDFMPAGWTITAQYYIDAIMGNIDMLEKERYLHEVTCSISKSFLRETLEASITGIVELNHLSSMINPSLTYSVTDELSVSLGANLFFRGPDSKNRGTYTAYEDLDCISLKAVFSF